MTLPKFLQTLKSWPRRRKILLACLSGLTAAVVLAASVLAATGGMGGVITAAKLMLSGKSPLDDPFSGASQSESVPETLPPADPAQDVQGPEAILGAWLIAGRDFAVDESYQSSIDAAVENAAGFGFNALIVPLNVDGKVIYTPAGDYGMLGADYLSYLLKAAHQRALVVYAVQDILAAPDGSAYSPADAQSMAAVRRELTGVCMNYPIDGLLLDGYQLSRSAADYSSYTESGGGMGYDAYRRDKLSAAVRDLHDAAGAARDGMPCGIVADAVWATAEHQTGGMDVSSEVYEAYPDGYADTLGWIDAGYADCVLVKDGTAIADAQLPFETVARWWAENVGGKTRLYFSLAADRVGSGENGWGSPDELIAQLQAISGLSSGSVFRSLSSLLADTTGSTGLLREYLKSNPNEELGITRLTMTSPASPSFITYESTVSFIGASDPNAELTLNGKAVERTKTGYFSLTCDLQEGVNTFEFRHKEETLVYTVTRRSAILRSVLPDSDHEYEGGILLSVGAMALNGAKVTASLGGKTISLKQSGGSVEDAAAPSGTRYVSYEGVFELPAAQNEAQKLGNLNVTATLDERTEAMRGGAITVLAKPSSTETGAEGASPGTGAVPGGDRYVAEIVKYQAETLDGDRIDERSRPVNAYLPKGTVDYCEDKDIVYYNPESGENVKFRRLGYGKRVYSDSDNVKIYQATLPDSNSITAMSADWSGRHTQIVFDTQWNAPFDVALEPQSYTNPYPGSGRPDYSVSSLTYTYLEITFSYTVSAQGKIDMSENPVFSKAEWLQSDKGYKLRLTLRRPGVFYGWTAEYNSEGQLVFYFLNPAKIQKADNEYGYSLDGIKIVVDAGHGGADPGAVGSSKQYTEAYLNLLLSQKIQRELTDLGATVIMTRSTDYEIFLIERAEIVNREKPDLFISVHRNSGASNGTGYEDYYFHPFSKPLAEAVYKQVTGRELLYGRGVKYYPYYVTRVSHCPAILTENGFVSNAGELERLKTDAHNEALAKATVQGIVDYFVSIQ